MHDLGSPGGKIYGSVYLKLGVLLCVGRELQPHARWQVVILKEQLQKQSSEQLGWVGLKGYACG